MLAVLIPWKSILVLLKSLKIWALITISTFYQRLEGGGGWGGSTESGEEGFSGPKDNNIVILATLTLGKKSNKEHGLLYVRLLYVSVEEENTPFDVKSARHLAVLFAHENSLSLTMKERNQFFLSVEKTILRTAYTPQQQREKRRRTSEKWKRKFLRF